MTFMNGKKSTLRLQNAIELTNSRPKPSPKPGKVSLVSLRVREKEKRNTTHRERVGKREGPEKERLEI